MRALVLFCLTGCDALFRLSTVDDPPSIDASGGDGMPGTCFHESFSGTDSDLLVKWNRGADSSACQATVSAGELLIELDPSSNCYADAHTIAKPSFVGGSASVHVTSATVSGSVETLFALEVDFDNMYFFGANTGELSFRERVAGVDVQQDLVTYDPVAHAYWQFLYVAEGPRISFRTSPNGETWVERFSATPVVPLDALSAWLIAGTYSGGTARAEVARFDDFERCTP